jgi:O-succinylbenzoic acid--CoA ligase
VKVAPAAVEATLAQVPGVAEVVLAGVPHDEWGQQLVAVIVPASDGPGTGRPDPDALRASVRAAHGPAAAPRAVVLVDGLPRRGPGKPDRAAVRDLARRALATDPGPTVDLRTER